MWGEGGRWDSSGLFTWVLQIFGYANILGYANTLRNFPWNCCVSLQMNFQLPVWRRTRYKAQQGSWEQWRWGSSDMLKPCCGFLSIEQGHRGWGFLFHLVHLFSVLAPPRAECLKDSIAQNDVLLVGNAPWEVFRL